MSDFPSRRASLALVALFPLTLAACGPSAQPAQPTAAAKPAAAPTAARAAQASAALTALPKPNLTPSIQENTVAGHKQWSSPPPMTIDQSKKYEATIETNLGTMKAELFAKDAPITVNNFVFLAREGYYSNVPFHRIIKGFMAQTGDPTGTGTGGPGYKFKDEPVTRKYERGTLAMANAGANTNGSQFFIIHQNYNLPPNYTIFGALTDGLDVLDKIANVPVGRSATGEGSKPQQPVQITSITIAES